MDLQTAKYLVCAAIIDCYYDYGLDKLEYETRERIKHNIARVVDNKFNLAICLGFLNQDDKVNRDFALKFIDKFWDDGGSK